MSLKLSDKKEFQVDIDWSYYLDMLLVEVNVELDNLDKAE